MKVKGSYMSCHLIKTYELHLGNVIKPAYGLAWWFVMTWR